MIEHGRLLALIRRFLDTKDEHCLANLLDDVPPDSLSRLISALRLDERAVVVRLMATRRDGTSPMPS